ncbi:two-component regulator propeller domain-containing protein [Paraglaciecola sp. 20A4]|uniref:two-component regulator propeller domain-containing protein n=1 Tax=Paraglaciecola sp. 20A4 TaxID=2687288 RepID=UPI00140BC282|nr:two-component regulator propeller domain-containing protein [Paraglaciecola sp. 20A4]
MANNKVFTLHEDANDSLWVGTENGLNRFDPDTQSFKKYVFEANDPTSLSHNIVTAITDDAEGNLWVGTRGGGLNRLEANTRKFTRFRQSDEALVSISGNHINALEVDGQGDIWIGTELNGLNRFNLKSGRFFHYRYQTANINSVSDDTIYTIENDNQGNVWIGTHDGGVNFFNPKTLAFNHYQSDVDDLHSLHSDDVYAFAEDSSGNLWVGTDSSGLNYFNAKTQEFSQYSLDTADPADKDTYSIYSLKADTHNNLWIGANSDGLYHIDLKTRKLTKYIYAPSNNATTSGGVSAIAQDKGGNLWIGTFIGGLYLFDVNTKQFTRYNEKFSQKGSFVEGAINVITPDSQGKLWLGFETGLGYFDPDTGDITYFLKDENSAESSSASFVHAIKEDRHGAIWIGTSLGLNRYDHKTNEFILYTEKDGLPNNVIYSIEEDNSGEIWLGTNNGLSKYNVKNGTFKNYNVRDGLQSNEFTSAVSFKSITGELFFGGIKGFNRFFPERIEDNLIKPSVVISSMFLLNKRVPISQEQGLVDPHNHNHNFTLPQAIHLTDNITLSHNDNIIAFEFSALSFTNTQKNQYAYKLEGFDNDWITTDYKNRRATYTNLSDGTYLLKVIASNNDGYWNEEGTSLKIVVLPPLWKTWWAYTLYCLLFCGLLWFFVRVQLNKVAFERKISEDLEVKVAQRTSELQKANQKLEELTTTDQLTGLKNRRFLLAHLKDDVDLSLRKYRDFNTSNTQKSVLGADMIFFLIDLDHFKKVNDMYGHASGDSVLIQIKAILEQVFRETDYLVRWGGEEFLVIVRFTERNKAAKLAERLRLTVENYHFDISGGQTLQKTCSIGFACYPFITQKPELLSWVQVINIADYCMYAAKNTGRNAWVGVNSTSDDFDDNAVETICQQTQELAQSGKLEVLSSVTKNKPINWSST